MREPLRSVSPGAGDAPLRCVKACDRKVRTIDNRPFLRGKGFRFGGEGQEWRCGAGEKGRQRAPWLPGSMSSSVQAAVTKSSSDKEARQQQTRVSRSSGGCESSIEMPADSVAARTSSLVHK